MASLAERALADQSVRSIVENLAIGHKAAAHQITALGEETTESSVRRYRKRLRDRGGSVDVHTPPQSGGLGTVAPNGRMDQTSKDVTFHGVLLDHNAQDAQDWSPIFKIFGLSIEHFEIVDDTVRISTWQQSKRLENGDRDTVQLWAHSARFRRISADAIRPEVVEGWRQSLMADVESRSIGYTLAAKRQRNTYVIFIADPQFGKKGTAEAVENWKRGVRMHMAEIQRLAAAGAAPERVHVAWMGDETEGVANNYTNQPHTVEMNQSAQLELDYDMRVWTLRELATLGIDLSASSVISNHGEWTRNGSKDVVTTKGDNASTFIARMVKKTFDALETFGGPRIQWHIADSDPALVITLSGVKCYFTHGHIEKGKGASTEIRTKNAMERQIIGRTEEVADVTLFFTAHYHHAYFQEFEGRTLFGMSALEAEKSSEYMRDQYGVWSPPGMVGLLVTPAVRRGWSNYNVF